MFSQTGSPSVGCQLASINFLRCAGNVFIGSTLSSWNLLSKHQGKLARSLVGQSTRKILSSAIGLWLFALFPLPPSLFLFSPPYCTVSVHPLSRTLLTTTTSLRRVLSLSPADGYNIINIHNNLDCDGDCDCDCDVNVLVITLYKYPRARIFHGDTCCIFAGSVQIFGD